MLEKKLLQEVNRFKEINRNSVKHYLMEQAEAPALDAVAAVDPAPEEDPAALPPAPEAPANDLPDSPAIEDTEEVDVTDLVNMTKNIKNDLETSKVEHDGVLAKMDNVFSKLDDLETKLNSMDSILAKIDQIGARVEEMKPQTPQEKLEMRSLDSYPFSEKPQEFFAHKQDEMRASGKNEYVLTKNDIQNYSKEQLNHSFNPYENEQ